jgi:hypothetical protein
MEKKTRLQAILQYQAFEQQRTMKNGLVACESFFAGCATLLSFMGLAGVKPVRETCHLMPLTFRITVYLQCSPPRFQNLSLPEDKKNLIKPLREKCLKPPENTGTFTVGPAAGNPCLYRLCKAFIRLIT